MGNLKPHKTQGVREAIEAAGATLLYLPPYSPDLNPIEFAFARLKALPLGSLVPGPSGARGRVILRKPPFHGGNTGSNPVGDAN